MPAYVPMAQDLVTPRLHLRRREPADAEELRELWLERDPRSLWLVDADGHPTVEEMRERVATQLEESEANGLSLLAVERRDAPGFLGYCGLLVGSATVDEPEIAFELHERFHGQGYATEAAGAVVDAARATGRSRLWATVREWNLASLTVLRRNGFGDSGRRTPDPDRGETVWMTLRL